MNSVRLRHTVLGLSLLALNAPGLAQNAAPPAQASVPAAAEQPAAASPKVSVDDAYKREFAFLEAQKRELQARLAEVKRQFEQDRSRLEAEVQRLESDALAAQSRAESMSSELIKVDQQAQVNADNSDLLQATYEQARATLESQGSDQVSGDAFAAQSDPQKLNTLFSAASDSLQALRQLRSEPGSFFLADGSEVQGTLIRYGNVATFGVSETAAGALAPAGGGRFRLWNAPQSEETARALAANQQPLLLRAFLYENSNQAVSEPEAKTIWGEVAKGGLIGTIILCLGALAMVLVVLRAFFLQGAGASIANILDAVTPAVQARKVDDAIAGAKRFKGSAARVVTAALRNADREREHLEDIVSESILHESTHLSRFGNVITMIAAVAPLLGLLGTVTGMIQTFDVITEFGTSDPKLLSGGIATALVTTELGLVVAIPCLLAGGLLAGWADRIKDDMEKAALRVINLYQDVRSGAA
ncbi:MotA/TolQ/ExbB proton channel family protein [Pseudomarimonas arenosa]|uniref:MotA/TolQ/ExbB proton channel family protein n=1 Tax=Pseudomarimonas arenosa TaxID=2774145 RepID=A0AAW3ZPC2_9GAMM|nr:MotA/TolQ/ExbB proton channel family protein [Pseudomarimonas arenosa]MBD8527034.1 MotA/TolQ/ExbB proton channel family protein [Pseudomarimonas arenosa]